MDLIHLDTTGKVLLGLFHAFMVVLSLFVGGLIYSKFCPVSVKFTFLDSHIELSRPTKESIPTSLLIESKLSVKNQITYETRYYLKPLSKDSTLGTISFPITPRVQLFSTGLQTLLEELKLPSDIPPGNYLLHGELIVKFSPVREEAFVILNQEVTL